MALKKVTFRPGIVREATNYVNEGGWYDGDKIRFRGGLPEKLGGWKKAVRSMFQGSCRSLHEWMALDSNRFLGLGTHLKFYILWGDAYYDITPLRGTFVLGLGTPPDGMNPFTTAGGGLVGMTEQPAMLIVHHTEHKATTHDFVTFLNVTAGFDVYTVADLNGKEFQIVEIIDKDTYKVDTGFRPGTTAGIHGGGGPVSGEYQVFTGLDVAVPGTGWGASPWGGTVTASSAPGTLQTPWGMGYDYHEEGNVPISQIRLWSQDNFGQDLIFCIRNGTVFYWDRTTGVQKRAVPLAEMPGADNAPLMAFEVMISEGDRHVVAIGTNDIGSETIDPLLVRWSSQENPFDWYPRRDNTAGTYRLSSGSSLAGAIRTRQETLIFTEKNLHSMRFTGDPYIFGFNLIAENVSLLSANAAINAGGRVWWMDRNTFLVYTGAVQELPCTVRDYVFGDFNMGQRQKVFAGHNHNFQEVCWFYPSAKSQEVDRYVFYNYVDQVWAYGQIERTAWLDLVFGQSYPVATAKGILYNHEVGDDADDQPLVAWVESSDIDLEDGEHFVFIRRLVPDVVFRGKGELQSVGVTLRSRRAPGDFYTEKERQTITPYTKEVWVRARGRQFSMRLESESLGTGWRVGAFRVDMIPDGRR